MKLGALFTANARRFPDKAAVICDRERRTFLELETRANQLADALIARGVRAGDRVIVYLGNSIELVEAMAGILKTGALIVPLSTRLTGGEVAHVASDCEPKAAIYSADLRPQAAPALETLSGVNRIVVAKPGQTLERGEEGFTACLESGAVKQPLDLAAANDDLMIAYTSGTTGRPKGAVITHNNMIFAHGFLNAIEWGLTEHDVILATTAMAHRTGLGRLANTFSLGCALIMQSRFDADDAVSLIEREKVTVLGGVPTVYRLMAPELERRPEAAKTVRLMVATGEVFPVPLKERLMTALPHAGLYSSLSQTEAGTIAGLRPQEQKTHPAALGRPLPGVEVRIVDPLGAEVPLGTTGEIAVRCGTRGVGLVLREYFRNPQATEEAFHGEWFRTGDVGYCDEDGYLYFADRAKDMIVSGGLNIYSKEVELCLAEHPAVEDAAVFGVPDSEFGEAVSACVQLKAGKTATAEALIEHCRERIASYKKPRHVHLVAELPKTGTGKIMKAELKKRYSSPD